MIKEKKKVTKYNYKKSVQQIAMEYLRTVMLSVLFAAFVTTGLSIHARNEMIKNLYASPEEQLKMDRQIAIQLINSNTNLMKDLSAKKYSVCIQVGNIYETAGDYQTAQMAYQFATEKAKQGDFVAYYKLLCTLVAQEKFDEAEDILESIQDKTNKKLIKFKTRSYIVIGDKYYSLGKFLSAAKNYEKAKFYYDKFTKKDSEIDESIKKRIINAYTQTADIMVKSGYNSDAVRFLKKVEALSPDDFNIKYKLGIILSDSDPEQSVKYLEPLADKMPQNIDYGVYCNALMKAANIADLDGRPTQAKYYRYKVKSIDLFVKRKVIYKNDIETVLKSFTVRKVLFTYPLKATYRFENLSGSDIKHLYADLVLTQKDKELEIVTTVVADKENPLLSIDEEPNEISVKFRTPIFTKKELENYTVRVYLYKDPKFKTLVAETKIPEKSFDISK